MQHHRNLSRRQFLKSAGAAVITASTLGWNYAWRGVATVSEWGLWVAEDAVRVPRVMSLTLPKA
jgi:hypothetical protein